MEYNYIDVNDCNGYGCYVDIETKYMLSDENDIIYLDMIKNTMKIQTEKRESLVDKLYPAKIQKILYERETSERDIREPTQTQTPFINHIILSIVIVYICLNF